MSYRISARMVSAEASLLYLSLMAFLPFLILFFTGPVGSNHAEFIALLLGGCALLPLVRRDNWDLLEIPQSASLLLGLIAVVVLQHAFRNAPTHTEITNLLAYLTWAGLLLLIGHYLRRQLGWQRIATYLSMFIVLGVLISANLVMVHALAQLGLTIPLLSELAASVPAIGKSGHFGIYIMFGVVSLLYLQAKGRIPDFAAGVLLLVFMAMLGVYGSKTGWLYLIGVFLVSLVYRLIRVKRDNIFIRNQLSTSQKLVHWTVLMIPLFFILQVLISFLVQVQIKPEVDGILAMMNIWFDSLLLFVLSPFIGMGVGQTAWTSLHLNGLGWLNALGGTIPDIKRNGWDLGLFQQILLFSAAVVWLKAFKWQRISLEGWWLLSILLVMGIQTQFEYQSWHAGLLGLAAVLLGAGDEKTILARFSPTSHSTV
jgi:hypothetical protein